MRLIRTVGSLALVFLMVACSASDDLDKRHGAYTAHADWAVYNGNPGGTHHSSLDQINTNNIGKLAVAWTYETGDAMSTGVSSDMQSNPIIIGGRLVFVSPKGRIISLDGATGREVWTFNPADTPVNTRQRSRGVSYWTDGQEERILFTFRQQLIAIDFKTGALIKSFGSDGRVDLREGLGRAPESISVTNVTPGVVHEDLIILGSTGYTPGHIRAYDVRTGEIRWIFHTIPQPGEIGAETWPKDAWKTAFGANAWAGLTLDPETGTVFVPTASGGMLQKDFYGADRAGDNLFANSLVALDASTGKLRWHFQTVRHDLWDRDLPTQPTLITVRRDGVTIPAIAQPTKSGFVFILNRRTGESLFPLEHRPAPKSDVPGEVAAETQVFPLLPKPFARQQLTSNNLTQRTPEAHAAVAAELANYRNRGPYDPPSLQGTIILPGLDGGAEWGGASFDPETGLLYVNSNEMPWILQLEPRRVQSGGTSGRSIYLDNCASCHGDERAGSPPEFPSLLGVGDRLPQFEILLMIRRGSGRMPAFANLSHSQIETLTEYLITGKDEVSATPVSGSAASTAAPIGAAYEFDNYKKFLDPEGYPAIAPPWGTLTAIDVSTGRHIWRIPFGEYPELAAQGIRNTGSENYGGGIVTAGGLFFIGATAFDRKFHAFDKRTGKLLWEYVLPAGGNATPSTYMAGGRQFVVMPAGGGKDPKGKRGGSIVAFALPSGA